MSKKELNAYRADRSRLWKQAERKEKQDMIYVGKMAAEHYKKWWD